MILKPAMTPYKIKFLQMQASLKVISTVYLVYPVLSYVVDTYSKYINLLLKTEQGNRHTVVDKSAVNSPANHR